MALIIDTVVFAFVMSFVILSRRRCYSSNVGRWRRWPSLESHFLCLINLYQTIKYIQYKLYLPPVLIAEINFFIAVTLKGIKSVMLFSMPVSLIHFSGYRHAVKTINQLDINSVRWKFIVLLFSPWTLYRICHPTLCTILIVHFKWLLTSYQNALSTISTHLSWFMYTCKCFLPLSEDKIALTSYKASGCQNTSFRTEHLSSEQNTSFPGWCHCCAGEVSESYVFSF